VSYSPFRLMALFVGAIFAGEAIIMLLFGFLDTSIPPLWLDILDPFLLSIFLFPILFILFYKPMKRDLLEMERAKAIIESENRLKAVADSVGNWIWEADHEGKYTFSNPVVEKVLGYKPEEIVGRYYHEFMHPDDREEFVKNMVDLVSLKGHIRNLTSRKIHKDGHTVICESNGEPIITDDGELTGYRGAVRDITEKKQAEDALKNIATGLPAATGEEFFDKVVRRLSESLEMDYVLIGKLTGENLDRIAVIAAWGRGEAIDPFEYALEDAPCGKIVGQNICSYTSNVAGLFPDDNLLREINAESYCGTPLFKKSGEALGLIALIDGKPMKNIEITESTLLAFADRVSSEMERMSAEEDKAKRIKNAEFSAQVGKSITKGGSLNDILQSCAQDMVDHLDAAFARIWVYNKEENFLSLQASAGMYTNLDGRHSSFPLSNPGKITAIAKTRTALFTNKFADDPSISDQQWAKREKIMAFAGHPLIVEDRLVGVIALFSKDKLSEVTIDTLEAVADEIAIGVVRKKSEDALRESRGMLKMVMDNIPQYIFWKDFNSVYKGCNKNFAKSAGVGEPDNVLGKTDYDMPWKKDEADFYRDCDRRVMDTNAPEYHIVETQRRADGKDLWIDTNKVPLHDRAGKVIGILGTYEDITEKKQVEEERALLSAAIKQAAELVIITSSDEKIEYVNPAFEKITGYKAREVKNKTPRIIGSGKQSRQFYKKMWGKLLNREVWRGRLVNKKKDDSLYQAQTTISPIVDSSGKVSNFICVQRDVTRETQLERQFRQSQKMEAIGVMAGGIAHDFNNILSAIIGYTELAIGDSKQERISYENLTEVMKAASRAKDLVKQILTFSRRDDREMRPVDLAHLITETIKLVRASLPSTIEIQHDIDADSGQMLADPTLIQQVLLNLCANAEHSMREKGGKLTIKLSAEEPDAEQEFTREGAKERKRLKLTVRDTGCGIEKKIMDRIFDPFFTTKAVGEGTGLGLATVHGIVASHGGAISVHSMPNEGAVFTIFFPQTIKEEEYLSTESDFIPKGDESILFVDDEAQLLNLGRQTLERLGYDVVTAADGGKALEIFKAHPDKFDLVITDQTMPGMTGEILIAKLHEIRPGLPVILCTGYSKSMTLQKAKAAGAREFIIKPVLSRDLGLAIRRVVERRKLLRRARDMGL